MTGTADLAIDLGFGLAEISVAVGAIPAEVQEGLERAAVAPFRSQSGRRRSNLGQTKLKHRLRLASSARPGSGA